MYMEIVGCRAEDNVCPFRPPAMLFHGISGGHIQGIMEEMERRSKTEARLAKGAQLNGRDTVRRTLSMPELCALWSPCSRRFKENGVSWGDHARLAGGFFQVSLSAGLSTGLSLSLETSPLLRPRDRHRRRSSSRESRG